MDYKLIGMPCGQHGPYTFYKGLKYNKNGKTNILALSEFFFVKLWTDSDLISIGELQLLWEDKNSEQTLASLRLYILPESTPDGRTDLHGEDEVLAITEKVVIRVEDLLTWITHATDWHWGIGAIWGKGSPASLTPPYSFTIDMDDVNKEKECLETNHWETHFGVVVLSYPRYCRYRGVMKRLQGVEEEWLKTSLVVALGGFTTPWKNTRILFCKETFDYPELEGHELLCNHLAPKLKGRPRKRKRATQSPTESETESESSSTASSSTSKAKAIAKASTAIAKASTAKPRLRCTLEVSKKAVEVSKKAIEVSKKVVEVSKKAVDLPKKIVDTAKKSVELSKKASDISKKNAEVLPKRPRPTRGPTSEERNFMSTLQTFMKERKTPISRIPVVGFKEVNLFKLYKKVCDLGGYDVVTTGKLWKYVYEVMGGDMSSTSAATLSRRHYEKLLLPYERHLNGTRSPPKPKPPLTAPPTPLPTNQSANNNNKDKGPSLRNIRLKQEKSTGGKENIPQRREIIETSKPIKIEPEIIDLVSDEPPTLQMEGNRIPIITTSVPRALSPLLKKQKLEILKEGGLEVTPVGGPAGANTGSRASVIKQSLPPPSPRLHHPMIRESKVSITVTPDMSHLLSPGPSCSSAGGSSKRPVYGNPKEVFLPPPITPGEILDLRTNKPRINIGSNLEITLVPSKTQQQQRAGPPHPIYYPSHTSHQHQHPPTIHSAKPVPYPYQFKPSYMPMMDHRQVYLSALYNNSMYRPYSPQPIPSIMYKELLRRQGIFPSLDGTTSITLVGQTPTSK